MSGLLESDDAGLSCTDAEKEATLVITVPVVQVTLAIIVGLFVLQMVKRLTATSNNPIAMGVTDGIAFLTS